MDIRQENDFDPMDHRTSKAICDAVGERLQQHMRPEKHSLSPRLQRLLEELRQLDS